MAGLFTKRNVDVDAAHKIFASSTRQNYRLGRTITIMAEKLSSKIALGIGDRKRYTMMVPIKYYRSTRPTITINEPEARCSYCIGILEVRHWCCTEIVEDKPGLII